MICGRAKAESQTASAGALDAGIARPDFRLHGASAAERSDRQLCRCRSQIDAEVILGRADEVIE
jgi:hypothetical protein